MDARAGIFDDCAANEGSLCLLNPVRTPRSVFYKDKESASWCLLQSTCTLMSLRLFALHVLPCEDITK